MDEEEFNEILELANKEFIKHIHRYTTNSITMYDCLDYWVALEVKNKYNKKDK